MPYSTPADLLSYIGKAEAMSLSLEDANASEPDGAVIQSAIARADALIDTYLRGRYEVPLSAPTPDIQQCSLDITVYYLAMRRSITSLEETIKFRYEEAVKLLRDLANGKLELGAPSQDAGAEIPVIMTNNASRTDPYPEW